VLPRLGAGPQPRELVVAAMAAYLSRDPEPMLVADWPEDIAHAAALLVHRGRRMVPHVRFDLINLPGFDTATMSALPHNALADAQALRREVLTREALALGNVAA
jgi:hypothetical protein